MSEEVSTSEVVQSQSWHGSWFVLRDVILDCHLFAGCGLEYLICRVTGTVLMRHQPLLLPSYFDLTITKKEKHTTTLPPPYDIY